MENVQKAAEELLENLNKELISSQENAKMLQGAMEGIKLLFQKLQEQELNNNGPEEEGGEPSGEKKAKKAK